MIIRETPLSSCVVLKPTVFTDERGYFYEKFNQKRFEELTGQNGHFVQDNVSKSSYGVVRGIHLQKGEHAQAKLVSCLEGVVWDVAVDLREESPTFGKWFGVELSAENKLQFYIPRGFGHAFSVLSESAVFAYKCDNYYNKESEGGVLWNDSTLQIDWKIPSAEAVISEKDKNQHTFEQADF
ncbi:dTDP-4-dehydrorhamnose 3,5-epimerase [Chryseobacterium sp. A301]